MVQIALGHLILESDRWIPYGIVCANVFLDETTDISYRDKEIDTTIP